MNDPIAELQKFVEKTSSARTVKFYQCDKCDQVIQKPEDGFLVLGNIYVADPNERGGLIGNNFPEPVDGKINPDEIHEVVYCRKCFLKAVGIDFKTGNAYKAPPRSRDVSTEKKYIPRNLKSKPLSYKPVLPSETERWTGVGDSGYEFGTDSGGPF